MDFYENDWTITINDSSLPDLKINSKYEKMLLEQKEKKVKSFIQAKLESANWFLDALKQRHQTLFLIINSIIKRQPDFFNNKKILKPMILKDVAKDINMDVSTISRMTNGKYVQLPFGIYELKYFFSEGIKTNSGELISNKTVKELLKDIIKKENKKNPYGDEKLTTILNEKGYKIARRTVTKYRELLKIPVGRLRKEL
jgi:RNA polymerase sigma-54 factor